MHYLALDLETTGLNPGESGINEIALVHYSGDILVSEFNVFPNVKDCKFSLGALKVNDYRSQMSGKGENLDVVRNKILEYFKLEILPKVGNKKVKIVGHNVAFDVQHLKNFLGKLDISGWEDIFDYSVIDTSTIGQFLRDTGVINLEKMSLGKLAVELGIEVEESKLHGAMYDAKLSMDAYLKMKRLIENIKRK